MLKHIPAVLVSFVDSFVIWCFQFKVESIRMPRYFIYSPRFNDLESSLILINSLIFINTSFHNSAHSTVLVH